ncbi:hypothetical protein [Nocardia sp. BMG51109]|uniref:hypothetical protein n=1 Tax=Nocardia sp. BMG51109 TaxID=1056816 RepID=UPI00046763F7|nr:hypothetical protein [Nocardia sp. BMG51109]
MDYQAEMDRILAEYGAATREVRGEFLAADERTSRGGAAVFDDLRQELNRQAHPETPEEAAAREARDERDRLLRETTERARTEAEPRHARETYVLPTDWTEEDEARMEGYGPPDTWLR